MKKIAIIGGGNLGTAIALGLIKSEFIVPQDITITKRNTTTLAGLEGIGVTVTSDNVEAVKNNDTIILAIKPFQIKEVLELIAPALSEKHLLISVVTGVSLEEMKSVVNKEIPMFRTMPNTAIAIQESITCISTTSKNEADKKYVSDLFNQLGKITIIDEKLMNAATVLGACGTAYAMRYIRANIQGGIEIGFDAATASLIAAQTVKGAAELLLTTHTHPEQEIDKVTTPKGCTIAGLNEMEHQGFSSSLIKGIVASYNKIGS
ncbi:MAG: pyrroline-5-carboxylate reductase [Sphingobacteriales bacterium]|nr:MAG: pyrroline-5-carboxylate reductase [Sphingobacteriales bacterium]